MPDVGPEPRDDDLDRRTADGFVVWGPLPAVDPLRRYRAEAQGRVVQADDRPAPASKAEKRAQNRATARRERRLRRALAGESAPVRRKAA